MFLPFLLQQTRAEWQKVFFLSSGIYAAGALFYIIFGSGELQSWGVERSTSEMKVHGIENGELPEKQELVPKVDSEDSESNFQSNTHVL